MIWMKKKMNKFLDTFHFSLFVYRSSVYDQLKINENCVNTELLKNAAIWHLAEIKYSLSCLISLFCRLICSESSELILTNNALEYFIFFVLAYTNPLGIQVKVIIQI